MRFLALLALVLCLVAVLAFAFLVLVRELLARDFFGAPSLPGGSIIALLLCLYASTVVGLNRAHPPQQPVEPVAACRGCPGA